MRKKVMISIGLFSLSTLMYSADSSFADASMMSVGDFAENVSQESIVFAIAQRAQDSASASNILLNLIRKAATDFSLDGQDGIIASLEKTAGSLKDVIMYIKNLEQSTINALDTEAFLSLDYFEAVDIETLYDLIQNSSEQLFEFKDHQSMMLMLVDYIFFTLVAKVPLQDRAKAFFDAKRTIIRLLYREYEICKNGLVDHRRDLRVNMPGQRLPVRRSLTRDIDDVVYQEWYTISEPLANLLVEVDNQEETYKKAEIERLLGQINL